MPTPFFTLTATHNGALSWDLTALMRQRLETMLTGMLTEGARSCTARRGLILQRRRVWWPGQTRP
jgi:hypothetical protein